MSNKTVFDLQQEGAPVDLVVVLKSKWNPQYHAAREISNSRFDLKPSGIAYCKNAKHVKHCVNFCRENSIKFRVRSGGHQHEGMSSGDNVLIIALSEIHEIEYVDNNHAWLPVGKQLQNVYNELEEKRSQIIPGGGCQSVNVGGLTHGGGWGLSTRYLGMTCDNLVKAEVVLANGDIVYPSVDNLPDLFWGIRGGGGGNFGIVTRFLFKLSDLAETMTTFRYVFEGEPRAAAKKWVEMHLTDGVDSKLSTGCSLIVQPVGSGSDPKAVARLGGQYYGTAADMNKTLNPFFDALPKVEKESWTKEKHIKKQYDTPQMSFTMAQGLVAGFLNPAAPSSSPIGESQMEVQGLKALGANIPEIKTAPPSMTCDKPHPHKVTSCFPVSSTDLQANLDLVDKIVDYMEDKSHSEFNKDVNKYISFHCLGGAVKARKANERGAFPYYDKPFLLQVQAWWDYSGDAEIDTKRAAKYVKWVSGFRKYLGDKVEGAFINFVDQELVENPNTPVGKLELLKIYYGDNLSKLRKVKQEYDEQQLFNFRMSIPPE